MKYQRCILFLLSFQLACSPIDVKEKINKAGDVAGQTVGEFASGISTGVEKAFEVNVELSEAIKKAGITIGKVTLEDSSGTDNVLTVYMIFDRDFKGSVTAKAFDSKGVEMGRVKTNIQAKKEDAAFCEFRFDKRTNIDTDSKVILE